jgi:hypothetical protein
MLISPAWAVDKPDFDDHEAVVASMQSLIKQCGADAACLKACNEAAESLSQYADPIPRNRSLRRNRWNACLKMQPAAAAPAAATPATPKPAPTTAVSFDPSRIVIAGLRIGGKLEDASDRLSVMDAEGWFNSEGRERGISGFRWSEREQQKMPDIVKTYEAQINDKTQRVYIHIEAAGDGTIYKIDFKQKGAIDSQAARQTVIDRFGTPTRTTSTWLYWGCEDELHDLCVKSSASEFVFEIFAQDLSIKDNWRKRYEDLVLEAKGGKKGLQF